MAQTMFALAFGLALTALDPPPAVAPLEPVSASDSEWAACANRKDAYSIAQRIAACTAVANRPGLSARRRATAIFNRSTAHWDAHDEARSLADLDHTLQLHPNYAMAHNNRGFVYFRRGDHERARADYDEAIRLDPELALPLRNRALLFRAIGDEARAEADDAAAKELIRLHGPTYRGTPISRRVVRTPASPGVAPPAVRSPEPPPSRD